MAASGSERDEGPVVCWVDRDGLAAGRHEDVTCARLAARLAALLGRPYGGPSDPSAGLDGTSYVVPRDTLVAGDLPGSVAIRDERQIFGGVVPFPFVGTKAITHPLVRPDARAPAGWSNAFGERVRPVVLDGWTVFSHPDAVEAGTRLLASGPVRLKEVCARGGHGQSVVHDLAALRSALDAIAPDDLARDGLVLEENLVDVTTMSVGQVRVGGMVASYVGTQRLATDNDGATVYGGSDLLVVRGGFEDLLASGRADEHRASVAAARAYDEAADALFPGFVASRRNYDVVQGRGAAGTERTGVLEQSWRMGGASGAEIAALERFRADPAVAVVRAATVELFGDAVAPPPPDAAIYFDAVDPVAGRLLKYATVGPP